MPTARPIITANTGVTLFSSTQCVVSITKRAPMPTPTTAEINGITDAAREPNVTTSTTNATPRPTSSEVVFTAIGSPKPAPPASTCSPASRPSCIASVTTSRSAWSTDIEDGASKSKVV